MQNGDIAPIVEDSPKKPLPEEVTKHSFRLKVWKQLETTGQAMFPRPVYNRIPNFKGAPEAALKLVALDVFRAATTVKVNPDKPQEPVRILCLQKDKALYVPVPRLQNGFLNRLEIPNMESEAAAIRKAVSRNGMETYGTPVGLDQSISLDLIVMGSVAVSKDGYRIGKGRGYGDLEFGLMMHMKAVKPTTLVVTTVHDCQVFDTLPAELFGPHDVPVDIIVTPTQVIETKRTAERPTGILWHLLSARRLQLMPVLAELRDMEILAGRSCPLKEVDTDVEERTQQARARRIRRRTRSHKSQSEGEGGNTTEGEGVGKDNNNRQGRRPPRRRNSGKARPRSTGDDGGAPDGDHATTPVKPRRQKKPWPVIDFTVKISNISPTTRVRELKNALSERGVKPQIMVWKGFRGFCYLHFIKTGSHKNQGEGDNTASQQHTLNMESVLEALKEMSIASGGGGGENGSGSPDEKSRVLHVEPAAPRQPRTPAAKPAAPVEAPATVPAAVDVITPIATEVQ